MVHLLQTIRPHPPKPAQLPHELRGYLDIGSDMGVRVALPRLHLRACPCTPITARYVRGSQPIVVMCLLDVAPAVFATPVMNPTAAASPAPSVDSGASNSPIQRKTRGVKIAVCSSPPPRVASQVTHRL